MASTSTTSSSWPAELILAIFDCIPRADVARVKTLRAARRVCRVWGALLLSELFRDVKIHFTDQLDEGGQRARDLAALCAFLEANPEVAACVQVLELGDETAFCGYAARAHSDEDEDSESDEDRDEDRGDAEPVADDDDGDSDDDESDESEEYEGDRTDEKIYRCITDPALLHRTLGLLPQLKELRLSDILLRAPLDRSNLSASGGLLAPIRLSQLRVTIPGWGKNSARLLQLVHSTLSIFDDITTLRINIGPRDDAQYLDIDPAVAPRQRLSLRNIRNFVCMSPRIDIIEFMASEPAFASLSSLQLGLTWPETLVAFLSIPTIRSSLTRFNFAIGESWRDGIPIIDLSTCDSMTDLTLQFGLLTAFAERHGQMVTYVNRSLTSLLNRSPNAPPLDRLVLRFIIELMEVGDDGVWAISSACARAMEDVLLELLEAGVYRVLHIEYDLQPWYASFAVLVLHLWDSGKEELDVSLDARMRHCESVLRARFPRLQERGVMKIVAVPVSMDHSRDPDDDPGVV